MASYFLLLRFHPNKLWSAFRRTKSARRVFSLTSLRGELARQTLLEIGASVAGAAPILLGLVGSILVAVLALIVAPLLYSVTCQPLDGLMIFAAHTLVASFPIFIVRQRILPNSFLNWAAGQPISQFCRMTGDAWATAILVAPLGGAYIVSSLVWVWQWPAWLRSAWLPAFASVLLSLFCSWLFGMLVLNWRWRADRAHRKGATASGCGAPDTVALAPIRLRARDFALARSLLWLPLWRQKTAAWHFGQSASIVLIGAGLMGISLKPDTLRWHAAIAPSLALLIVGLTLWRDAAMQRNLSHLMREVAAWPIAFVRLQRVAIWWTVLPVVGLSLGLLSALPFGPSTNARGPLLWFAIVVAVGAPMVLRLTKIGTRERWAFAVVWAAALVICGGNL